MLRTFKSEEETEENITEDKKVIWIDNSGWKKGRSLDDLLIAVNRSFKKLIFMTTVGEKIRNWNRDKKLEREASLGPYNCLPQIAGQILPLRCPEPTPIQLQNYKW